MGLVLFASKPGLLMLNVLYTFSSGFMVCHGILWSMACVVPPTPEAPLWPVLISVPTARFTYTSLRAYVAGRYSILIIFFAAYFQVFSELDVLEGLGTYSLWRAGQTTYASVCHELRSRMTHFHPCTPLHARRYCSEGPHISDTS